MTHNSLIMNNCQAWCLKMDGENDGKLGTGITINFLPNASDAGLTIRATGHLPMGTGHLRGPGLETVNLYVRSCFKLICNPFDQNVLNHVKNNVCSCLHKCLPSAVAAGDKKT